MKLIDYLNQHSWSKADLARNADVSIGTVTKALSGEPIARRNAAKIIAALQSEHERLKQPGIITLASIRGLKISDVKRHKPRATKEVPPDTTAVKSADQQKKVQQSSHDEDLQAVIDIVTEHPELTSGNAIFKSKLLPFGRSKITDLLNEAQAGGMLPGKEEGGETERE